MNDTNDFAESDESDEPGKSLNVAIEQVAQLLRTEVKTTTTLKMKQRQAKLLSLQALGPSMSNSIGQVARLLRSQAQKEKPLKKRSYSAQPSRKTKPSPAKKKAKSKTLKNS
ncbi:MAG: hypothetical protein JSR39_06325 [Verrucomicrobia bacterium]|nr:hypothetical protein [Verrucomicrobiota bacterium]